ncbi:MAG: glycosyltransferase [bacterium]|nr:glycosyltransferase [Candidatus Kapabacteria bacterium]
MKIALIGPAYPYRGGIAHHTNMLYTYLRRHGHEVDVITFTRQYPKILYPGQTQEEVGGAGDVAEAIPSVRLIDSINPFTWWRAARYVRDREYDLHVFRWWLPFFGFAFGTIARIVRKRRPGSVLVILDNLFPHEKRPGDETLTRYFFRQCDMAVCQSSTVLEQLARTFPDIPRTMLPHPVYENFGETIPRDVARRELGIGSPHVLLFFGFVRAYKGLDRLLAAMPEIVKRVPDVQLLVVGEFFEDREPYLRAIREGGVDDHVTIHDAYVPNEDVALWFSAADMLVLPYHSATNSGIVQIGSNFAVPAIVTNVGSLSEVVIDGETGFVVDDATPVALADAVERMYSGDTRDRFEANIVRERARYSWDAFVEGITSFVETNRR